LTPQRERLVVILNDREKIAIIAVVGEKRACDRGMAARFGDCGPGLRLALEAVVNVNEQAKLDTHCGSASGRRGRGYVPVKVPWSRNFDVDAKDG
jgi:hypothetical protein